MLLQRKPDFEIGGSEDPYMRRWHLIPKNRFFNIYLHQVRHSDDDRALHDHPWFNISILLKGQYIEVVPDFSSIPSPYVRIFDLPTQRLLRKAGSVVFRKPGAAHRLELLSDGAGRLKPTWSLFITGPKVRRWGYHCKQGWVWDKDYNSSDGSRVGVGCG